MGTRAAPPPLVWQGSLFGAAAPGVDQRFSTLTRVELDAASWIDVVPGWLSGADEVFSALVSRRGGDTGTASCGAISFRSPG